MSEIGPGPKESQTDQEIPEVVNDGKTAVDGRDRETNQWAMFIHFSILAGWIVPIGGLIVPIILWQMKKDELPGTVPHTQGVTYRCRPGSRCGYWHKAHCTRHCIQAVKHHYECLLKQRVKETVEESY